MTQLVKNLPVVRETWVRSLGWEDPLEKGTATHSSILTWRIPGATQSMGWQRVGHDWATFTFTLRGIMSASLCIAFWIHLHLGLLEPFIYLLPTWPLSHYDILIKVMLQIIKITVTAALKFLSDISWITRLEIHRTQWHFSNTCHVMLCHMAIFSGLVGRACNFLSSVSPQEKFEAMDRPVL